MRTEVSSKILRCASWRRTVGVRRAIAIGATCTILGALAACSSSTSSTNSSTQASGSQTVTIFTSLSGVIPGTNELPWQEWSGAFEKAYPAIHVNVITGASSVAADAMEARIIAAVRAGKTPPIDILDSAGYIPQLSALGDLVSLNASEIPNVSEVEPSEMATYKDFGVPYRGSSVVLAYNTTYVKNPPTTLSGLLSWIKAHPGKFAYNDPSGGGSGQAFAENVVEQYIPASLQSQFVNGYNRSLESYWTKGLDQLHALTSYMYQGSDYPKSNDDTLSDLGNGSVWMAPVWSDGGTADKENGELPSTIQFSQITPPFYGGPSYLAVVKGSPHLSAAYKLINYMLSPAAQQLIISGMNGYPGVELKYEPASVEQKFANIDTAWSQGWYTTFDDDFNSIWQQRVP
jgi:putative spermidine/putrescine transport system substrate-binding protein